MGDSGSGLGIRTRDPDSESGLGIRTWNPDSKSGLGNLTRNPDSVVIWITWQSPVFASCWNTARMIRDSNTGNYSYGFNSITIIFTLYDFLQLTILCVFFTFTE